MPTNNIEITEDDIGFVIHKMVSCGNAYIINISTIGEPFAGALGSRFQGPNVKKFLLFTCCEDQEQHAKNNIKEIVKICNDMIKRDEAIFTTSSFGESYAIELDSHSRKERTIH